MELDSVRRHLLADEDARVHVRRHWTVLLRLGSRAVGAFLVLSFLLLNTDGRGPVPTVLAAGTVAAVAWMGWLVAEWRLDRFVVTNRRVLLVTGLLTRRVAMMPLRKVTDMTYERTPLGRLLGYGAFIMESAGQDQALHRIDHVAHPDAVAKEMFSLLFGGPPAPPPQSSEAPRPAPAADAHSAPAPGRGDDAT